MKLLGWMHRKFRENNNETLKDPSIGLTGKLSTDDRLCYPKGGNSNKYLGKDQRDNYFSSSFTRLDDAIKAEEYFGERPTAALTELLHGFLAIGTLGTVSVANDSAAPTFSISLENKDKKETEVKADELNFVNEELEKVLWDGAEDETSSGKTTHVSTGRISQWRDIGFGGKPTESAEAYGTGGICSMQSNLSGSAIEQTGTATSVIKEHRTSLEELLQKTKEAEENYGMKPQMGKETGKQANNSALHLMKKLRNINALANSITTTSGETSDSAEGRKKLSKVRKHIKHLFSRKVHPENSSSGHHNYKTVKQQIKNKDSFIVVPSSADIGPSDDDIIIYPQGAFSKHRACSGSQSHVPLLLKESGDAFENETWIKTDEDYLVLEL